jgi:hypothetical protein
VGAELADRAIRLNPDYKPWASAPVRYAYFMAGRYEDALKGDGVRLPATAANMLGSNGPELGGAGPEGGGRGDDQGSFAAPPQTSPSIEIANDPAQ